MPLRSTATILSTAGIALGNGTGDCIGTQAAVLSTNPDPAKICTGFVERQDLTMRMSMRRFTRLTNAISKKVDDHFRRNRPELHARNFRRVNKTPRVTPAMEAAISGHVWTIEEQVAIMPEPGLERRSRPTS